MSRSATKTASDYPEFVVTREFFNRYFEKPLPTSTFHDLVKKGKITPFKGLKGFYELNASLRRMGLPQVRELPNPQSMEDIVRLAFTLIDRNLFPEPSWLLTVEALDIKFTEPPMAAGFQHAALDGKARCFPTAERSGITTGARFPRHQWHAP